MDDSVRGASGQAFAVKTREELDGQNSSLYKDFYKKVADRLNEKEWIPNSLILPDLHEDFNRSKPLPLNVTPIMDEQFRRKLSDNRYKMVKVTGRGLALVAEWPGTYSKVRMIMKTTALVTWKITNLNERCMNFGIVMTESPFCVKGLPIYYTYGTWHTIRHFKCCETTASK